MDGCELNIRKSYLITILSLKSIYLVLVNHGTNNFLCINEESAEAKGVSSDREICLAFNVQQSMNLLKNFYKAYVSYVI